MNRKDIIGPWKIDLSRIKIALLLLSAVVYHTLGFHLLDQLSTDLIVVLIFILVFFDQKLTTRVNNRLLSLISMGFIFGASILFVGLASASIYDLRVAYRFLMPAVVIMLTYGLIVRKNRPEALAFFGLKIYYRVVVFLIFSNLAAFILASLGLEPFFVRSYGVEQVRTYQNYLLASPSEPDRFISHFGEPSDFVLISTSGIFVALYFGKTKTALFSLLALTVSFSGSLVISWLLFGASLGLLMPITACALALVYLSQLDLQLIIEWALNQEFSGYRKFVQRFSNLQEGSLSVDRLVRFELFIKSVDVYPVTPNSNQVLTFVTNYFYYGILRLGYISFCIVVLYVVALLRFLRGVNRFLRYALISLLLLSVVREAFATSLFFSYLVTMFVFAGSREPHYAKHRQ